MTIQDSQTLKNHHPVRSDYDTYMMPTFAPSHIVPVSGQGAVLYDQNGQDYIDMAAGIAVCTLGHANPIMINALTEQAKKLWHVSNLMTNEPILKTAKLLIDNTFADKVMFMNSGAEANETALKLARRWAFNTVGESKHEIIAFNNAFHGRTFFTVCVAGQPQYSDGFGPKPQGITHLPFNDCHALRHAISDKTCAVILEPIQGEGGVIAATQDFMNTVREVCTQHNALMILDEVQTGVARTGTLYAHELYGIVPDILTTAKGMGGGFPISACLTKANIADHLAVGTHGSTYGGNAMAGATSYAVLSQVLSDGFMDHVKMLSHMFTDWFDTLITTHPTVFTESRGLGLLRGIKLTPTWAKQTRDFVVTGHEYGVMVLMAGDGVIRFAPPLNITKAQLKEAFNRFEKAIDHLVNP